MGLVVKTNVTALVKEVKKARNYQVNSITEDFLPALETRLKQIIEEAVERAHANNRRTLMARDL